MKKNKHDEETKKQVTIGGSSELIKGNLEKT